MAESLSIRVRRSQLGRVRGSGSAKAGVHHWYAERVTSVALIPLTLWFVFMMVRLAGASQETVVVWAGRPWNTVLLLALIAMTFQHMALGIQVVLEDYVHEKWAMTAGVLATKAACGLLALLAALSVLKLALW
jgi:succinate dehydrogenase / fumarate reductase membrane anchor subunit